MAGAYYYVTTRHKLPEYIAVSNGRIEAQTVDVATRSGGRVLSVPVEEGSMVGAGDVIATLDLNHLAEAL
ncbi:MAG: efflux transporter periplasmic adaptor subunit, partial [Azospirillum brasilense]